MRRVVWGLAGFFGAGLLVGVVGMSLPSLIAMPQSQGGYEMGVAFFWVPLGAVIGLIAGVVLGGRR